MFDKPDQLQVWFSETEIISLLIVENQASSNVAFTILATFFDENAAQHGLNRSQTGLIVAIFAGIGPVFDTNS